MFKSNGTAAVEDLSDPLEFANVTVPPKGTKEVRCAVRAKDGPLRRGS